MVAIRRDIRAAGVLEQRDRRAVSPVCPQLNVLVHFLCRHAVLEHIHRGPAHCLADGFRHGDGPFVQRHIGVRIVENLVRDHQVELDGDVALQRQRAAIGPDDRRIHGNRHACLIYPILLLHRGGVGRQAVFRHAGDLGLQLFHVAGDLRTHEGGRGAAVIRSPGPDRLVPFVSQAGDLNDLRLVHGQLAVALLGLQESLPVVAGDAELDLEQRRAGGDLRLAGIGHREEAVVHMDGEIAVCGQFCGNHFHKGSGFGVDVQDEQAVVAGDRLRQGDDPDVLDLRLGGLSRGLGLSEAHAGQGEYAGAAEGVQAALEEALFVVLCRGRLQNRLLLSRIHDGDAAFLLVSFDDALIQVLLDGVGRGEVGLISVEGELRVEPFRHVLGYQILVGGDQSQLGGIHRLLVHGFVAHRSRCNGPVHVQAAHGPHIRAEVPGMIDSPGRGLNDDQFALVVLLVRPVEVVFIIVDGLVQERSGNPGFHNECKITEDPVIC